MNIHSNARTCAKSRAQLIERVTRQGWSIAQASRAFSVSERTTYKWLARHRSEGAAGLVDRPSRPQRRPRQTPSDRADLIVIMRHCQMSGPEIAQVLGMPMSTVAVVLKRAGLGQLRNLAARRHSVRYERSRPGELVHMDVKKLGRIERVGHRITGNRRDTIEALAGSTSTSASMMRVGWLPPSRLHRAPFAMGVPKQRNLGVTYLRSFGGAYVSVASFVVVAGAFCAPAALRILAAPAFRPGARCTCPF